MDLLKGKTSAERNKIIAAAVFSVAALVVGIYQFIPSSAVVAPPTP
ncbi:MAG: hypothetical protein WKF30_14885 [Pyrinomonadaceae bacterium]